MDDKDATLPRCSTCEDEIRELQCRRLLSSLCELKELAIWHEELSEQFDEGYFEIAESSCKSS